MMNSKYTKPKPNKNPQRPESQAIKQAAEAAKKAPFTYQPGTSKFPPVTYSPNYPEFPLSLKPPPKKPRTGGVNVNVNANATQAKKKGSMAAAMCAEANKYETYPGMAFNQPLENCGKRRKSISMLDGHNVQNSGPKQSHLPPLAKRLKEREEEAMALQPQLREEKCTMVSDKQARDIEQEVVYGELSGPLSSWQDGSKGNSGVESDSSSADSEAVRRNDWIVKGEMPGGPIDGSVIPSFGGHIATRIWEGSDPRVLKCANRVLNCQVLQVWWEELSANSRARIDASKLAHLPWAMFSHIDTALITAFVERWQPDTNSFHLPFGEMTIMLHDVVQILSIPVDGQMVSAQISREELKDTIAELLKLDPDFLRDRSCAHWVRGCIPISSIEDLCRIRLPPRSQEAQLTAYLLLLLGSTLFVDKSTERVRPHDVVEAMDNPDSIGEYSWGSATLAYLYRQLGIASRIHCKGIGGCLTLLQAWIYEYFPAFRPHQERNTIEPGYPRSCMWDVPREEEGGKFSRLRMIRRQLDTMTASEVEWLPYGPEPYKEVPRTLQVCGYVRYRDIVEPYMADRVVRQLGYMQEIPLDILTPIQAKRSEKSVRYEVRHDVKRAEWTWRSFPKVNSLFLSGLSQNSDPSACDSSYLPWFCQHSHPHLLRDNVSDITLSRASVREWMEMAIRATKPFLKNRYRMPNRETSAACLEWDRIISLWNASPDNSNPTQATKK